jgi:hypothetical protein
VTTKHSHVSYDSLPTISVTPVPGTSRTSRALRTFSRAKRGRPSV